MNPKQTSLELMNSKPTNLKMPNVHLSNSELPMQSSISWNLHLLNFWLIGCPA